MRYAKTDDRSSKERWVDATRDNIIGNDILKQANVLIIKDSISISKTSTEVKHNDEDMSINNISKHQNLELKIGPDSATDVQT